MKLKFLGYFLAGVLIIVLIWVVYKQVREHHLQDDPMLHTLKEILKPVHPIVSSLKLYKGKKSYTINKEKIFMCLYDENGDYYSLSILVEVLLHEIAHILNTENIGHTPEFHKVFQELLDKAESLGIYNPNIPIPPGYCEY